MWDAAQQRQPPATGELPPASDGVPRAGDEVPLAGGAAGGRVPRRVFLRLAGAGVLATAALSAACAPAPNAAGPAVPASATSGATSPTSVAASSTPAVAAAASQPAPSAPQSIGGVRLPTHVPISGGPPPDLPGTDDGIDPGYFSFPKELFRSVPETPAQGGEVSTVTVITGIANRPLDQNPAWQEINKQLGTTVRLNVVSSADYPVKISTVVSSGDVPDMMYDLRQYLPNLTQFLRSQCADLTPYLSGDAVKDYPNLANLPTRPWANTIFDGKIYALPIARPPFASVMLVRQDLLDQAGLSLPHTAAEFKQVLQALVQPQANRWGIGSSTTQGYFGLTSGAFFPAMFGAPNNWRLEASGKLVKDWETEEYKAAVAYLRDLWAAGVFHPNTPTFSAVQLDTAHQAGAFVFEPTTFGNMPQAWDVLAAQNPNGRFRMMPPISHDGSPPQFHLGPGVFGTSYLKNGSPDRIKMMLRIVNYLAAPFGSQEWALVYYGVRGTDHTLDANGNPVFTDVGRADVAVPWKYLVGTTPVLYDSVRSEEYARTAQAAERAMLGAVRVADPTLGLYSAANSSKGVTLQNTLYSGVMEVVLARRPFSDMDVLANDWRTQGGDQIRTEYTQALAANKT